MLHEVTTATRPWLATCENASVTTAEHESASPAATASRTARRRPCERRPATALATAPAPPAPAPRAAAAPRAWCDRALACPWPVGEVSTRNAAMAATTVSAAAHEARLSG